MLTEMNRVGLSSICHGTKGLNGSALRAIRRTFAPALDAPGVGDPVPLPVWVQALRSSAVVTAAAIAWHPVFRRNMNLSLPRKKLLRTIVLSRRRPPLRARSRADRIILGSPASHPPIPRISAACSPLNPGRKVGSEEVRL